MITFCLLLFLFFGLLGIGFHITGAILMSIVWLFVRLPIAMIMLTLGVVFCCTVILIPLGLVMFRGGVRVLVPCGI